ncbi:hypothetical protein [Vibrio sp. MEBiC08052]|uniref:hypothetical protein n=1 Tax=Vibrio sp. MEBiC08052 TaxID=1761910 RepID=UPI0007407299|nr:hypothetical protein [Vibrio sp. MEBiC08052]KUI97015.1 hypothetical protein VRK_38700 [Vibrio sp. MEBiC08052]
MTDKIAGHLAAHFLLQSNPYRDPRDRLFADTLAQDELRHAKPEPHPKQSPSMSDDDIHALQQDIQERLVEKRRALDESGEDAPAEVAVHAEKTDDSQAVSLTYPLTAFAHGHLDYLDSVMIGQNVKRSAAVVVPTGDLTYHEVPINHRSGGNMTTMSSTIASPDQGGGKVGFGYQQFEQSGASKNNIGNEVSAGRHINEAKLNFLAKHLSRNVSYVRTHDGQIKIVIRDYNTDKQALFNWYHDNKSYLGHHHILVINGERQNITDKV